MERKQGDRKQVRKGLKWKFWTKFLHLDNWCNNKLNSGNKGEKLKDRKSCNNYALKKMQTPIENIKLNDIEQLHTRQ